MAQHINEELGVSFTTPDALTTRQYMSCSSLAAMMQRDPEKMLEYTFKASRLIITNWKCTDLPDLHTVDLDGPVNVRHIQIISWAGTEAIKLIQRVTELPKV